MFPNDYFPTDYFMDDFFIGLSEEIEEEEAIYFGGKFSSGPMPVGDYRYTTSKEVQQFTSLLNRAKPADTKESLTGLVQDQSATDIEERFARALNKYDISYDFQVSKLAPYNTPGEYRLDFLVDAPWGLIPVAIDGEYAHKSAAQKATDQLKDFEFMSKTGNKYEPVQRVTFDKLMSQDDANEFVVENYV